MAEPQATPGEAAPPNLVQFSIDRIYVKDLSLENPGAPQSFQVGEPPAVEIGLRTRTDQLDAAPRSGAQVMLVAAHDRLRRFVLLFVQ